MTRRFATLSLASLLLIPAGLVAQSAAPAAPALPTQKVLIHVYSKDSADWEAAMKKADNIMSTAPRGTAVVEILATGDGLKLIDKDGSLNAGVATSLDKDVSFVACHASMKANHMSIDQLHAGVGTVPSGGREMAMRKADGWTMLDDKELTKK